MKNNVRIYLERNTFGGLRVDYVVKILEVTGWFTCGNELSGFTKCGTFLE